MNKERVKLIIRNMELLIEGLKKEFDLSSSLNTEDYQEEEHENQRTY